MDIESESIDTATGKRAPAELSTERVHEIFSSIAKKYERFNALSSMGTYKAWLSKMVEMSGIGVGDKVLDIAGGTGDVSFAVARECLPAHIQCTDLVDEMLDVARMHYSEGKACGVPMDFEIVDAQEIPYEDGSFDAVTMAYGLRNMPKREQALSEVFRVLKPGGRLVCLDFSTPHNPAWKGLYGIYLRWMVPFWGKVVTGDSSGFRYLSDSIKAFPDQEGVAALMRQAGFGEVSWSDCTGGIACIHVAVKPKSPF